MQGATGPVCPDLTGHHGGKGMTDQDPSFAGDSPDEGEARPMTGGLDQSQFEFMMKFVKNVKEEVDLTQLGGVGRAFKKCFAYSQDGLKGFFNLKDLELNSPVRVAAMAIIVPVDVFPDMVFAYFYSNFAVAEALTHRAAVIVLMKTIRCALAAGQIKKLAADEKFQEIVKQPAFQIPRLYLAAQSCMPIDVDVILAGEARNDVLALYYSALNKLLLRNFGSAEETLRRAWIIHGEVKDIRGSISRALELCVFLLGKPKSCISATIKQKVFMGLGDAFDLWALDGPYDPVKGGPFYRCFANDIMAEHIRRVLLDLAGSVSFVEKTKLIEMCEGLSIDPIVQTMVAQGEIGYEERDGRVKLSQGPLKKRIEAETAVVAGMLKRLETVSNV
jgi:hypothetical protein